MSGPTRGAIAPSALAVLAFFAMALLPRATWPLIDPDVWWHIRAGEQVLQTGAVAKVDTWSLTAAGHPWTSQDWLSNVLLALGYGLGEWGMTLLSLVAAGIVVAAFAILWRAVSVRYSETGWLARVAWFSMALLLAGPVLGVRVQVIDLLFAAVVLWLLWRFLADGRRLWPALLPLVAIAWVNLHAGWLLLFLFGGAVVVGEAADRLLQRPISPQPLSWSQLGWLAAMLAASAAALALNPNGLSIYAYPGYTVGIGALSDFVGEWQHASLGNLFGWLLLAFVLLGVLPTLVVARRTIRLTDALILLGVSAMSLIAVRFLVITGPIGCAIIAANLSPAISNSAFGQRWSPMLNRLARPARGGLGMVSAVLAIVLLLGGIGLAFARAMPASQRDDIAREFPVGAVAWLKTHDAGQRVFNKYEWGGYLGLQIPTQPIFIDGRADVYGDAVIREYVSVIGLEGDPQAVFDRYRIDHVLFDTDSALGHWLDASSHWERAHSAGGASVWTRRSRGG